MPERWPDGRATHGTGQWAVSRAHNARLVAVARLVECHSEEFAELLAEERVARGLSPRAVKTRPARERKEITPTGGTVNRSVTITFRYDSDLRVLYARSQRAGFEEARERWGQWDEITSVSTPDTIYKDLIGEGRDNLKRLRDINAQESSA